MLKFFCTFSTWLLLPLLLFCQSGTPDTLPADQEPDFVPMFEDYYDRTPKLKEWVGRSFPTTVPGLVLTEFARKLMRHGLRDQDGNEVLPPKYNLITPLPALGDTLIDRFLVREKRSDYNLYAPKKGLVLEHSVKLLVPASPGYLLAVNGPDRNSYLINYDGKRVEQPGRAEFGKLLMEPNGRFVMIQSGHKRGLLDAETLEFLVPINLQLIEYPKGFATITSRFPEIPSRVLSQSDGQMIWESNTDYIKGLVDSTMLLSRKVGRQLSLQHLNGSLIWKKESTNLSFTTNGRIIYADADTKLMGMLNFQGEDVLPQIYRHIGAYWNRSYWGVKDTSDKRGVFSPNGGVIVPVKYDNLDVKGVYLDQKMHSFFLARDASGLSLYDGVGQLINSRPAQDIRLVHQSVDYLLIRYKDFFHPYNFTGKRLSRRGITNLSDQTPERYRSPVDALSRAKKNRIKLWATGQKGNIVILDQTGKYWAPEKYFND